MGRTTESAASRESSLDRVIEAYRTQLDLTLTRRNLGLTPEERIRQLIELQRFAQELRRAGRQASGAR